VVRADQVQSGCVIALIRPLQSKFVDSGCAIDVTDVDGLVLHSLLQTAVFVPIPR